MNRENWVYFQAHKRALLYRNEFAISPKRNKRQDKRQGKRRNCSTRLNARQGTAAREEGRQRQSLRLAKGDTLLHSRRLNGAASRVSPLRTMYVTINELSQECIVLLVREDERGGGGGIRERKRRFRHFPAGGDRNAFRPQIIAQ